MDLGTYKGHGTWGVSTLKTNPVTSEPMVVLLETEGDALAYARERALRAGLPEMLPGQKPDRSVKGRVYYVLRYVPGRFDAGGQREGELLYRVLRGFRGETQAYQGSVPDRGNQIVAVSRFVRVRETPQGSKIHWELIPALSVSVVDLEAEQERVKRSKGSERVSRADMGREPRGHKQNKTRQGRGPKFGPVPEALRTPHRRGPAAPVVEYKTPYAATLFAHQKSVDADKLKALHDRLENLKVLREKLEQDFLRTREQKLLHRIQLVEEKLEELALFLQQYEATE